MEKFIKWLLSIVCLLIIICGASFRDPWFVIKLFVALIGLSMYGGPFLGMFLIIHCGNNLRLKKTPRAGDIVWRHSGLYTVFTKSVCAIHACI